MNATPSKESPEYQALLRLHPDYAYREKLIRMCAGSSSSPLSYKDGVVEIEIRLGKKLLRDDPRRENLIRSILQPWMAAVPEARLFRAHIYQMSGGGGGFLASPSRLKGTDGKPDRKAIRALARNLCLTMNVKPQVEKVEEREWLPGALSE
ncbi:hypothetical protein JO972_12305 [Verrucomicrobiaceae bacterium 5K15]|uniref:Uncharacterized protein n=1 Tax=Oceaniferula flava TaxID=2800421 RepID=A0AAE2VD59_9BACT|nr:hypothetical protein [Oceaniferula flavus]MBK1855746.1 hypothetical protein [Oceaniferula flavus]MBM1137053.1 hypothetical protein [Oceaniferula flavus]